MTDYSQRGKGKLCTIYPFVAFECITNFKKDHISSVLRYAFFFSFNISEIKVLLRTDTNILIILETFFLVVHKIMVYLIIDGILDSTKLSKKFLINFSKI